MNKNQPSKQNKFGLGASRARSDAEVLRRLAGVRLLSLDVDGVMTDGGLYYTDRRCRRPTGGLGRGLDHYRAERG